MVVIKMDKTKSFFKTCSVFLLKCGFLPTVSVADVGMFLLIKFLIHDFFSAFCMAIIWFALSTRIGNFINKHFQTED